MLHVHYEVQTTIMNSRHKYSILTHVRTCLSVTYIIFTKIRIGLHQILIIIQNHKYNKNKNEAKTYQWIIRDTSFIVNAGSTSPMHTWFTKVKVGYLNNGKCQAKIFLSTVQLVNSSVTNFNFLSRNSILFECTTVVKHDYNCNKLTVHYLKARHS